jgi:hypothetical protein
VKPSYQPQGVAPNERIGPRCYQPGPLLKDYVSCYFSRCLPAGERGQLRTLPEGCADLMFDLGPEPRAWISGPRTGARTFEHLGPIDLWGVQFLPGVVHLMLPMDGRQILNTNLPTTVFPLNTQRLVEDLLCRLKALRSDEERVQVLDSTLPQLVVDAQIDDRIRRALDAIVTSRGSMSVAELVRECGTSSRHLTRLFHLWI